MPQIPPIPTSGHFFTLSLLLRLRWLQILQQLRELTIIFILIWVTTSGEIVKHYVSLIKHIQSIDCDAIINHITFVDLSESHYDLRYQWFELWFCQRLVLQISLQSCPSIRFCNAVNVRSWEHAFVEGWSVIWKYLLQKSPLSKYLRKESLIFVYRFLFVYFGSIHLFLLPLENRCKFFLLIFTLVQFLSSDQNPIFAPIDQINRCKHLIEMLLFDLTSKLFVFSP